MPFATFALHSKKNCGYGVGKAVRTVFSTRDRHPGPFLLRRPSLGPSLGREGSFSLGPSALNVSQTLKTHFLPLGENGPLEKRLLVFR